MHKKKNCTHLLADCAIFSLVYLKQRIDFLVNFKMHIYRKPRIYNLLSGTIFCASLRSPTKGSETFSSYFGRSGPGLLPCVLSSSFLNRIGTFWCKPRGLDMASGETSSTGSQHGPRVLQ